MNDSVDFHCGKRMKNRFALAPLTNTQSDEDGRLSDAEFRWLTLRAKGGFGMTMTCASHVQADGKGFPGQLGIFSGIHEEGHRRMSSAIKKEGSLAVIQLHHAGMRSPNDLIKGEPMCPSDQPKHNARAISLDEVEQLIQDFITAAQRAQNWGYDGVEVHGAHGYIIGQFLSQEINHRNDAYGGSLENRSRLLFRIIDGIRKNCGSEFLVGVRLSPERFGMKLNEILSLCKRLAKEGNIDFLDISLWDWQKHPEEQAHKDRKLLDYFTAIDLGEVQLTVAGKISSASDVKNLIDQGVDFVSIGKSAILHYDFPEKVIANPTFKTQVTPVTKAYLRDQGLSDSFINYMQRWPDFVV